VGLAPDDALAVLTKSIRGWMPAFDAGWERGMLFDGPGVCSMNFAGIPFTGSAKGSFPVTRESANPIEIWKPREISR